MTCVEPPKRKHGEQEKDPGCKSEGEDDSQHGNVKKSLGRTPNHLTLRYGYLWCILIGSFVRDSPPLPNIFSNSSTTSTLSVGSTGSQARLIQSSHPPAMYQPVLMKDLGKAKSPVNDTSEVELFAHMQANENGDDENGGVGDDERKFTEQVMDRHISQLESNSIGKTGSTVYDIAQYMAKLKQNHMESELKQSDPKGSDRGGNGIAADTSDADTTADEAIKSDENTGGALVQSSEDERPVVVIDKRVDKLFRSDKVNKGAESIQKESTKMPHKNIQQSRSPDRNKLSGCSPIRIVKIRSPRNSLDADAVILTRGNSRDRSISPKARRTSDGMPMGGILKRNSSPGIRKPRSSPDRQSSPSISRHSLSPHASFDSRSPDRSHFAQHGSSFDDYTSERRPGESYYAELSFARSPTKKHQLYSNQSSFESKSPARDRKRSLSAHSTFNKSLSPEPSFQCSYGYDNQHSHSTERAKKRVSKSLERCSSKESDGSYRRGYSPERIYHINQPVRSHSAENPYTKQSSGVLMSRSNESLTRLIEHPTCIECLYQRKPS